ncbi:MAG TPA: GNAT family N-acetyltransferase, partial [Acidimicrobiales bacterium]|nr:GNAT family N-acetyltransferase [Acidimicrobiales bacterium]
RVPAARTYALRGRVLRPHAPERASFPGDDEPEAASFAAIDEGDEVVGTVVVYPEDCPWRPGPGAWRLRGMATEPVRRSSGIGSAVLAVALDHVAAAGGDLVWCYARTPARRFYERAGFRVHGDEWVDPEIGPHVAMWRPVSPA